SGGGVPNDAVLFVEELREAIVNLTVESEKLETVLSQRGTVGIIQRARSTRQDLVLAESEVETANDLCERWKVEEEAAIEENARLQAKVVEAQVAVQLHRTALSSDETTARMPPRSPGHTPSGGNPHEPPLEVDVSTAAAAGGVGDDAGGDKARERDAERQNVERRNAERQDVERRDAGPAELRGAEDEDVEGEG
ncbi:unnamed protein product, partial [Laminaria digitata]